MDSSNKMLVTWVKKRMAYLKADQVNWKTLWQDVADYVVPNKDNIYQSNVSGEKKTNLIFDSCPTRYNRQLANALYTLLTNPTVKWFEFTTGQPEVDRIPSMKEWLQKCEEITRSILNASNFGTEIHSVYEDLSSFCTAPMYMHEDEEYTVRFQADQIFNTYIGEDSHGMVNEIGRTLKWDLSQIVDEFGTEWMDDNFKQDYARMMENGNEQKYCITHLITPWRANLGPRMYGKQKFVQLYVLDEKGILLERTFFESFPCAVPRWVKISGEKYGRGPGIDGIPDVKTLNAMKKVNLMGAQMAVAPPMQATDNSMLYPPNFKPFGMNYRRPGSEEIKPIVSGARPDIGQELIDSMKQDIKENFFIDQIRIVENDRMTATEIIQRRDEQFKSFGAVLGRLNNELLKPVIDRTFFLAAKQGKFPRPPEDALQQLKGDQIQIKYTSMIARAQASIDAESLPRALNASAAIIETQPQTLDLIDGDEVLKMNMDIFGVNTRIMRKKADYEKMRADRAQAAQQQAQQQSQLEQSEALKNTTQAGQGI